MTLKFYLLLTGLLLSTINTAVAHHVLGRPAYSLGADSNTPPSLQVEAQMGEFYITYMAFPAFPKPGVAGRVNLYVKRIDNGMSFDGVVRFKVRDNSYFSSPDEILGSQTSDAGVYRQGFVIQEQGDFLITAEFESQGESYSIDFPLQIGTPSPIGVIGIIISIVILVLIMINFTQAKKLFRIKAQHYHAHQDKNSSNV